MIQALPKPTLQKCKAFYIDNCNRGKVFLIKGIREQAGLGLKDAKELVEIFFEESLGKYGYNYEKGSLAERSVLITLSIQPRTFHGILEQKPLKTEILQDAINALSNYDFFKKDSNAYFSIEFEPHVLLGDGKHPTVAASEEAASQISIAIVPLLKHMEHLPDCWL